MSHFPDPTINRTPVDHGLLTLAYTPRERRA
jgi:hypothetical protein